MAPLKAKDVIPSSALSSYLEARVNRFINDNKDTLGECNITVRVFSKKEEYPKRRKQW